MATEKRLIDANSAVEYCRNRWGMNSMTEKFLNAQPTVDAVEVVHGQWEFSHTTTVEKFNVVKCSNCGHEAFAIAIYVKQGRYCPNCGAKMDDERRGE